MKGEKGPGGGGRKTEKRQPKKSLSVSYSKKPFSRLFRPAEAGAVSSLSENARKGRMCRKLHDKMALEGRMYRAGRVAGQGASKNGRATVTRDELASTVEAVVP